jgi:hypothetical protein
MAGHHYQPGSAATHSDEREFFDIIYADLSLVRAAFDALVAANWTTQQPVRHTLPIAGRASDDRQHLGNDALAPALTSQDPETTTPAHRQRSPPYRQPTAKS